MENVMKLYYLLADIESNFEDLYVQYKDKNILDCCQLTAIKYKNILNIIMKINRERDPLNLNNICYVDKFLITNFNNSNIILISYPLVGTEYSRNLISIYYNDNLSIYIIYYSRYAINISYSGIEILYRHCCESSMLIIILSAQRKFSTKQSLPPEIYNFIYGEFLYGKF